MSEELRNIRRKRTYKHPSFKTTASRQSPRASVLGDELQLRRSRSSNATSRSRDISPPASGETPSESTKLVKALRARGGFMLVTRQVDFSDSSKIIPLVFLASVVLVMFYYVVFAITPTLVLGSDFVSYFTGGLLVKEGERSGIYNIDNQFYYQLKAVKPYSRTKLLAFKAPPFVAGLYLPMAYFPLITAYKMFAAFNLFLLGVIALFSARVFPYIKKYKFWFLIPFIYIPSAHSILQGQTSIIIALLFLSLFYFVKSKRSFMAGLFCALLLIKPQYVIVFPFLFLLTQHRLRFLFGFSLSFLVLGLISIRLAGLNVVLNYPTFLVLIEKPLYESSRQELFIFNRTQDWFSINSVFLITPIISRLRYQYTLILNGLFYLVALYSFERMRKIVGTELSFASAILFSVVFAIHVLSFDLTIFLVPIYALLHSSKLQKESRKRFFLLLVATLLFLLPNIIISTGSSRMIVSIATLVIAFSLLNLNFFDRFMKLNSVSSKSL